MSSHLTFLEGLVPGLEEEAWAAGAPRGREVIEESCVWLMHAEDLAGALRDCILVASGNVGFDEPATVEDAYGAVMRGIAALVAYEAQSS